ncbi:MAG: hypothetical protein L0216_05930 [Planctomycetales bacterium]|nr:hypothetical protein [Planctomycetales bacterium]
MRPGEARTERLGAGPPLLAVGLGLVAGVIHAVRAGAGVAAAVALPVAYGAVLLGLHRASVRWLRRLGHPALGRAAALDAILLAGLLPLPALFLAAAGDRRPHGLHGLAAVVLLALAARAWPVARLAAAAPAGHAGWAARVAAPVLAVAALARLAHGLAGDEPHYLLIARSLATDADLDVGDDATGPESAGLFPRGYTPHGVVREDANGHARIREQHLPGLPALLAPGDAVLGRAGAVAMLAALGVFLAAGSTALARRLGASGGAALAAGLVAALAPPAGPCSVRLFPEIPAAALLLAAGLSIARLPEGGVRPALAAAAALSALPWLNVRYGFPALALGLFGLWRARRRPLAAAAALAVVGASAVAFVAFLQRAFGAFDPRAIYAVPLGYLDYTSPGVAGSIAVGLALDRRVGLLVLAPIWIAAVAGAVARPRMAAWAVPLSAVAGATALNIMSWDGSSGPAGRFLAVALPTAAPVLAFGIARLWQGGPASRALLALLLVATALQALAGLSNPTLAWIEEGERSAPLLARLADPGPLLPDWDYRSGGPRLLGTVLIGALVLAAAALGRRGLKPDPILVESPSQRVE